MTTDQKQTLFDAPVNRRSVIAAAWAAPVIVAAVATPLAAASGSSTVQSVEYTSFTAADFQDDQINVNRPLAISITGALKANDTVTLTVDGAMVRSGGGAGSSRTTPFRMSASNGPNFSVVSSTPGAGGSQTLVLTANVDLPEGTYRKTISWVPLEGATSDQTAATILAWPLGTYTAAIVVSVGGVSGSAQAYTLNRTPAGGSGE